MNNFWDFFSRMLSILLELLNETSSWLFISFIVAGLLHNILSPERLHRMLGNRKISSLFKATVSGFFLPVCSCGVIPLGIGLYYSGAYLGPTLAFMTSTPVLNPIAILLTFAFLGKEVGILYMISGIIISLLLGLLGNYLAGSELHAPGFAENEMPTKLMMTTEKTSLYLKIKSGLEWGFLDLGLQVSKYVVPGLVLAALVLAIVPAEFIQSYLGNPGMISILGVLVLSGVMYVCAIGHVPFIAALIAAGAAPGVAITFLMAGAATNIPELVSMYKTIGKRAAIIYCLAISLLSVLAGYIANLILTPNFIPLFDLSQSEKQIALANNLIVNMPHWLEVVAAVVVVGLWFYAILPQIKKLVKKLG